MTDAYSTPLHVYLPVEVDDHGEYAADVVFLEYPDAVDWIVKRSRRARLRPTVKHRVISRTPHFDVETDDWKLGYVRQVRVSRYPV